MRSGFGIVALAGLLLVLAPRSLIAENAVDMQTISHFSIDRTEVTIGQFARFVAATGFVTKAERTGGGLVYAFGWEQKAGWTWRAPYGRPGQDDEPAVHITFDEAQTYCRWTDRRLPREREWLEAAYTERRAAPPQPFERGRTYPYPTGASPKGANCLNGCGKTSAIDYSAVLERGRGHARAGTTRPGVNGLYDMGANVWEWVDTDNQAHKGTRGGSWWYGTAQMQADYDASKPRDIAAIYIGFRCVNDIR